MDVINNQVLACPHDKLCPNKVYTHTKIISKDMADLFYSKYKSEGPRFSGKPAMCSECVTAICRKTQWKGEVETVKKTFRQLCNNYKPDGFTGRW